MELSPQDWGLLLGKVIAFVFLVIVCIPVRLAMRRWFPEGKLKRFLMTPLSKKDR